VFTCTVEQSWPRNLGVIGDRGSETYYSINFLSECWVFYTIMWLGRFDSHMILAGLFVSQEVLLNRNTFILYCRIGHLFPEFSSPFHLIYEAFHNCFLILLNFYMIIYQIILAGVLIYVYRWSESHSHKKDEVVWTILLLFLVSANDLFDD
jgi:hypothetical protein